MADEKKPGKREKPDPNSKEGRLAAALRANLRRRKSATRSQSPDKSAPGRSET